MENKNSKTENVDDIAKDRQLVVFEVDGEEYAVNITDLQEVINIPEITPVPNSPDFIKGILNLRGKIVVVIDLEKRFNLVRENGATSGNIIISEIDGNSFGVVVDEVKEIISVASKTIQETPSITSSKINTEYLNGVVVVPGEEDGDGDRLIILLNLRKILKEDELDQIGKQVEKM